MLTLGGILEEQSNWGWAVGIVQQEASLRQVGAALGVHHTVITRAWERYRIRGTPARRHAGGQPQHQLRIGFWSFRHVVQGFRQELIFKMTFLMLRGPCVHADGT
jgi:hypothetical protein